MGEAEARAAVVAEARSWVGTPYHACADLKGAGVDCGMLLVRVFVDLGLVEAFDPRPYPPDWHLHKSEERYLDFVARFGKQVEVGQPGDIVIFRYGRCYSHGGVVTAPAPRLALVHAFIGRGRVIEEPLSENPEFADPERKPRFYSIWAA